MHPIESRRRILFVCSADSCRGLMAEGWTKHLKSPELSPVAVGEHERRVDPRAAKVMAEVGVDIAGARVLPFAEVEPTESDVVVLLDDGPSPLDDHPNAQRWRTEDPRVAALQANSAEEELIPYRRVRNDLRVFVEGLPGSSDSTTSPLAETSAG